MIVASVYESAADAENESDRLNALLEARMEASRDVQPDSGDGTEHEAGTPDAGPDEVPEPTPAEDGETSKVYIGKGAGVGGTNWVPLPREVVFEEIAPLVRRNLVGDDDPHVKVNFSSDVPISGWNTVDADVVKNRIVPMVDRFRTDDR